MPAFSFVPRAAIAITLALPCSALAAPLNFDCDVPANRFSSVSQEADAPLAVSGMVKLVSARSGANLPVAGTLWTSADGQDSAGFQMIADDPKVTDLNIVINVRKSGEAKKYALPRISAESSIPFRLTFEGGKIHLTIGDKSVEGDFASTAAGKMMVFCSTAQFKFTELEFSPGTPHP